MQLNPVLAILLLSTFGARQTTQPHIDDRNAASFVESKDNQSNNCVADRRNSYSIILERNVFKLTAPPSPAPPSSAASSIKLTGLIKVAGQQPRALFAADVKATKATVYFNLGEGERQGNLEVVKLLVDQESAEVIYADSRLTITLKDSKINNPRQDNQPDVIEEVSRPGANYAGFPNQMPNAVPMPQPPSPFSSSGVMVTGAAPAPKTVVPPNLIH